MRKICVNKKLIGPTNKINTLFGVLNNIPKNLPDELNIAVRIRITTIGKTKTMHEIYSSGEKEEKKIALTANEEKKFSQSSGVIFLLLGAPDFRGKKCVDNEMLILKQALSYSHHTKNWAYFLPASIVWLVDLLCRHRLRQ